MKFNSSEFAVRITSGGGHPSDICGFLPNIQPLLKLFQAADLNKLNLNAM